MNQTNSYVLHLVLGIFVALSFLFPFSCVTAENNEVFVDDSNMQGPWDGTSTHPYHSIQDGIDAVAVMGTVHVASGLYREYLLVSKSVVLSGAGKGETFLEGNNTGILVNISANEVSLTGFNLQQAHIGVLLTNSSDSLITDNTFKNHDQAISIDALSLNTVIHANNFIGNAQHAYDEGTTQWYLNGRGNYWDDYTGVDGNNDGIGDTAYVVPGKGNLDRYPLIIPHTLPPTAHFTILPTDPTTQNVITFMDNSTDDDGVIVSWNWSFGDGNTSLLEYPTHQYPDDGIYTVTLQVADDYGVTDQVTQQLTVLNVPPTVTFTMYPQEPTDLVPVNFTGVSTDVDGIVVNRIWDFGDGTNTTNVSRPFHQYADDGEYWVNLTVIDDDGAIASSQQLLTVHNVAPTARFSYATENITIQIEDEIHFEDTSTDLDGEIVSCHWDFGDGTQSNEHSPIHNYTVKSTYTVTLTVQDDDGSAHTASKIITVLGKGTGSSWNLWTGEGFNIFHVVILVVLLGSMIVIIYMTKKY
jgi:PKD repeat protein